jgi:putative transposase
MPGFLTDADIDRIALRLIDRSLPKSAWTHAAHFAVALWLLKRGGLHAMREMPLKRQGRRESAVPGCACRGTAAGNNALMTPRSRAFALVHKDSRYESGPIGMPWTIVSKVQEADRAECVSAFRTLRFKVRAESYAWLNRAAVEVNQVWNWANSTSFKAARPYTGRGKFLSGFDLCNLSAGATEFFEHIGADTIQQIFTEYAGKRSQAKKVKLRWRVSQGSRRSLGWVPFKAASLRRRGKYLRFCGKTIRFFEAKRFCEISKWQCGAFAQDAVGDWYLCLPVPVVDQSPAPSKMDVGIDLGLTDTAVTSDTERLNAGKFFRSLEHQIGAAQRRGHKAQAKRLHRRAARRRQDALHVFSRRIINAYQNIYVGDVSSLKLAKTRMAKAVLDSGWGMLKAQLQWKGRWAGRSVRIVNESHTSRTCSACGALSGPQGVNGLRVRLWICHGCGETHDRDVNAARNILAVGRLPPSVSGNESSQPLAPPSRASRPRKAGKASGAAAA